MRTWWLGLPAGLVVLAIACTGDDPVESTVPDASVGDAGGDATVVGPDAAGDAPDAGPPTYGVFLTSTQYAPDFAADAGDPVATIDALCSEAAAAVKLPRAENYHAVLVTGGGAPFARFGSLQTATTGRWCEVFSEGGPHVDCTFTVFASPADFAGGPQAAITLTEKGINDAKVSGFYSGFTYSAATGTSDVLASGTVQDCGHWTNVADGGVAGFGAVTPETSGSLPYQWLTTGQPQACAATLEAPLLCLELP